MAYNSSARGRLKVTDMSWKPISEFSIRAALSEIPESFERLFEYALVRDQVSDGEIEVSSFGVFYDFEDTLEEMQEFFFSLGLRIDGNLLLIGEEVLDISKYAVSSTGVTRKSLGRTVEFEDGTQARIGRGLVEFIV